MLSARQVAYAYWRGFIKDQLLNAGLILLIVFATLLVTAPMWFPYFVALHFLFKYW